jgi:hypothetical protein
MDEVATTSATMAMLRKIQALFITVSFCLFALCCYSLPALHDTLTQVVISQVEDIGVGQEEGEKAQIQQQCLP